MESISYEVHNFQNTPASFIFHKNVGGRNEGFISNFHMEMEILYTVSGSETICIGDDTYVSHPGEFTIVNSGLIHAGVNDDWVHHVLIPTNDFLEHFGIHLSHYTFPPQIRDENLKTLFLEILRESETPGNYREAMMRIAIEKFLIALLRDYGTPRTEELPKTANGPEHNVTTRVLEYLSAHFSENFPIDQISESIGITTPYMCHCVKQATGMSIIDHLNTIRCRAAYHYLIHSSKKISEIATLCGFNGRSYFAKVYQKTMGVLPSEVERNPVAK